MDTAIIRLDNGLQTKGAGRQIERAGEIIKSGGLVAFPTETVYGLGGDAMNPLSAKKIYAAKGRPSDNPLIVHICRLEDMDRLALSVCEAARRLADLFWPGPLTLILPKKADVPDETTGGLDTVAIRFPSHPVAQALIAAAGGLVAAPSANASGRPSPTSAKYVAEDMAGKIDMILDAGPVGIGLESTIIDLTGPVPTILRPGYVTEPMLREALGLVETDPGAARDGEEARPKAPGMKYRHYAPKGQLTIVEGEESRVISYINSACREAAQAGKKSGIIAATETAPLYQAAIVASLGCREDGDEIAHNLYRILREFDDAGIEAIYSESFSANGLGDAIMNRLLRAAGHRVVHI